MQAASITAVLIALVEEYYENAFVRNRARLQAVIRKCAEPNSDPHFDIVA
jgi:hypothetical protein